MKVYVVTSGVYSDYQIQRIFSNIEAAKEFVRLNDKYQFDRDMCSENEIEEYELYDKAIDKQRGYVGVLYYPYDNSFIISGFVDEPIEPQILPYGFTYGRYYMRFSHEINDTLKNREKMLKICQDTYAFEKAKMEGIT